VQRASKQGRFGVLRDVRIAVSMRRVDEERMLHLAVTYAWCEAHAFAGRPVRSSPFEYRFGAHAAPTISGAGGRAARREREVRLSLRRAQRRLRRASGNRWRP
jgi:hypothetical protein